MCTILHILENHYKKYLSSLTGGYLLEYWKDKYTKKPRTMLKKNSNLESIKIQSSHRRESQKKSKEQNNRNPQVQ